MLKKIISSHIYFLRERESLVHLTHTNQTFYVEAHCENISSIHDRRDFQHPYTFFQHRFMKLPHWNFKVLNGNDKACGVLNVVMEKLVF